jgi:arylsulfatase
MFWDFGDAVAEIDWSAGEIIKAIDRKDLGSDTLILFTSDHGPWYQGSPGALRGRKASTFEGGFRVPLLARWKGTIAQGRVCDEWISSLDILPSLSTLCSLAPPAKPLDGSDVSAALIGGRPIAEHKPILYFSPMGERGLDVHCIRKNEWKVRVAQGIGGEVYLNDRSTQSNHSAWLGRPELYNLALDPAESYDVASLYPTIADDLMRKLEELIQTFPPEVIAAYTELKARKGNITTPPGASPRPQNQVEPGWSFEPDDRSNR